jgi:hypothetical protein
LGVLLECGLGKIAVQCEREVPLVLKGEAVDRQDIELPEQEERCVQLPSIAKPDLTTI